MAITFKITSFVEYVYRAPTTSTPSSWHLTLIDDILRGRKTWATELQLRGYECITSEILGTFTIICHRDHSKFVVTGTYTKEA
jgi:hypothetical protein